MKKYSVIHNHEYGTSVHYYRTPYDLLTIYNNLSDTDTDLAVDFVNKVLGIDFEPDLEEFIEFHEIDDDIKLIDSIPSDYLIE